MKQKIIKVGNSLGVTIPADFVKAAGVKMGESVEVLKRVEKGEIVYKFSGIKQLLLSSRFEKKSRR